MRITLNQSVLLALVILQCTAYAQQSGGGGAVAGGDNNSASAADIASTPNPVQPTTPVPVEPTTTAAPVEPTTTAAPVEPTTTQNPTVPTATTTTVAPVVPSSTTENPTSDAPNTPAPTAPSNSRRPPNNSASNQPSNHPSSGAPSASSSGSSPSNSPGSNTDEGNNVHSSDNSSKTATIAGSVVGGIVGLAFIAGLLTWLNRRGGCTSRTRRRDKQDFDSHDNEYDLKMTDNHNLGAVGGAGVGAGLGMAGAAGGAMHSSDNLPPSPFQHARRFVPPTSNPTGYMNLTDEEYGYHQNNPNYQQQGYQDYNNVAAVGGSEYDYQQRSHPDYSQDYQQDYHHQGEYIPHQQDYDYQHDGMVAGGAYQQQGYYNHAPAGSNVTSPTLTNVTPNDGYRQQLKPDQIEQKPNAA